MVWEKMSKSRGNVICPEEVVYTAHNLKKDYEFRTESGIVIDYREHGVWRDNFGNGCYFTASRYGKQPVFLCEKGKDKPCLFTNGEQHS